MPDPISWTNALPYLIAALIFGYVLGSIPFGLVLTRFAGLGDIRSIGSGNIGATNVLRTGKKGLAAATLLLDCLKGAFAVWIASQFGPDPAIAAGLGAFLGHCFPIWLKFAGGKGVATYLGILLAFSWKAALLFAAIWICTALVSRYSSLSALLGSLLTPIALLLGGTVLATWASNVQLAQLFALLTAILWWRHRENIARLFAGTEGKIGKK